MADYTYKLENDEYVFYKDGEVLKTPHNAVIKTTNEQFAELLLTNLKHMVGYTAPFSFLTYHYTYCNLDSESTQEIIANDFSNCISYDSLMNDDYLMFRQPGPVKQAIAVYYEKKLPERLHTYNLYQLSAILVIQTAFQSWMLSHYIIADIIEPLYDDENADLEALKEEFLDDLEEYECEEFDCDPEDDAYIRHRKVLSQTITAFVSYFTLD